MKKVYIAYSITGTHCFISANREMTEEEFREMIDGGHGYSVVHSRRPNYNEKTDGVKVHFSWLENAAPEYALKVFKALEDHGWTVFDRDDFVVRYLIGELLPDPK